MKRTGSILLAAGLTTAVAVTGVGGIAFAQTTTAPTAPGREGRPHGPRADVLGAAAKALGLSADDLKSQLTGGKTIAQVAQDKGVDPNTVIAAVTDAITASIDQAVADGKMTADKAAEKKAEAKDHATRMVNEGPRAGGKGGRRGPGGPGARFGNPLGVAASTLNMSVDDLKTALQAGKTIAQVAQEKGVDPNTIVAALTDTANKAIDQAVTDGRMNSDQATQAKAKAAEHAAKIVNEPRPARR